MDSKYYAPAFTVKLNGMELEPLLLKSITSLTVTKQIQAADQIQLELQDQMEGGTFVWLDKEPFKMGQKISVEMGYTGDKTQTAEAHVTGVKTKFTSGLCPTMSIEAKDKAFTRLNNKSEQTIYKQKKDSDIVSQIAREMGLQPIVDPTDILFEEKIKNSHISCLDFIKIMVQNNTSFEFFISQGKLYFRKAPIDKAPAMTLTWGQQLKNFSPQANIDNMVTGVTAFGIQKKETVKAEAMAGIEKKNDPKKQLGSQLYKTKIGEKIETINDQPVDSKEELDELVKARLTAKTADFVTASGETPGIPGLNPGTCIQLEGLGKTFSGKYYVTQTTHTIDAGGYNTHFEVRSNVM